MKIAALMLSIFTMGLGVFCVSALTKTEETQAMPVYSVQVIDKSPIIVESEQIEPAFYSSSPSKDLVCKDLAIKNNIIGDGEVLSFVCERKDYKHAVVEMEIETTVFYDAKSHVFNKKHKEQKKQKVKCNYELVDNVWLLTSVE